jgi:4-amino-4-deoxy-L-arabinose transferase-like glycosyltransferase
LSAVNSTYLIDVARQEPPLELHRDAVVQSPPLWKQPEKWALISLLVVTGVLYLWGLGASGWANTFYSAAVQAGSKSWKAMFFGSFDGASFITVDKSPAFLWVMDISARIFGVNSWSVLVPQALEGVAAVGVLYATVRRWFPPVTALLAGAALALTPVAALMFRFNNPDALLTLLLTTSAYAMVRAVEDGRTRWLVLAGSLVGFGFLTKMLQALLVLPALALVYLVAGPTSLGLRLRQLLAGGLAFVVAAGWWVAVVQLLPASSRPYIGGSQNNSLWNLIFGYNGFGRLTGSESGSVGGGGGTIGRWGPTGLTRLFDASFGGQVSWLLPAALILLAAGVAFTWRAGRFDRDRSALVLWGGWFLVAGAAISLGQGIIHPYYTVMLAPAIAALVAVGATIAWRHRATLAGRGVLSGALAVTAVWSYQLLARTPTWLPMLRGFVLVVGLALAGALLAWPHLHGRPLRLLAGAAVAVALIGPGAYSVATAATVHTGAIPSAGPAVAQRLSRPGGGPPNGGGAFGNGALGNGRLGQFGGGGFGRFAGGPGSPPGGPGALGGGVGGLLSGATPPKSLVDLLKQNSDGYTWVVATVRAEQAAAYQLAIGKPVMAIGGFNGTDPAPTLAQFETLVGHGKIHYFITGGGGGPAPGGSSNATGSSAASQITSWVESHFTPTSVGGVSVYDLSQPVHS